MKKLFVLLLTITMVVTMAGCSSGSKDTGKKTILAATSPDFPPFNYLTSTGELTGFETDMVEWIFNWFADNGYNYELQWKHMGFDTIISAVQADQVDLGVSGFSYRPDRAEQILFTDKYLDIDQVILVTTESTIASKEDLAGKNIGVESGTTGADCAQTIADEYEGTKVTLFNDYGVIMETLKAGGIDAVIVDDAVAYSYVENTGYYKVVGEPLANETYHFVVKLGNQELADAMNAGIKAFMASPDFEKLKEKYGI